MITLCMITQVARICDTECLSLLTRILHWLTKCQHNVSCPFQKPLELEQNACASPLEAYGSSVQSNVILGVNAIHKQILMEYMLPHFRLQTYIKPIASSHNTPEINRLISRMFKSLFLPCKPNDNFISRDSSPWSLPIPLERVSLCQKKSACQAIDSFFQQQCIQSMDMIFTNPCHNYTHLLLQTASWRQPKILFFKNLSHNPHKLLLG